MRNGMVVFVAANPDELETKVNAWLKDDVTPIHANTVVIRTEYSPVYELIHILYYEVKE